VATSSSSASAKKVAKLAQRDRGKKVRFQGGTLFPAIVLAVLLVGLVVIIYARQSRPDPGTAPPQVGDHWHAAYGMYVCDGWLPKLSGAKEEQNADGTLASDAFATTGIHSHDDGVIHWHPYSAKAVGDRAVLGVFLDVYDVELSDTRLELPADQGGDVFDVDGYQCNGKDVTVKVVAWDNYADTGKGQTYITDLNSVRLKQDGMVFVIAVVPKDTEVAMPPWASELPALGAVDGGNVPGPSTTAATDTTAATETTAATSTTGG
jgi:hypothetical protein